MSYIELLGWLAAGLVLLSFSLKTMVALRVVAIASNVVFFAYGALADVAPVMVLHGLLFPLNLWRLHQMRDLLKTLRRASRGNFDLTRLTPHMEIEHLPAGTVIFRAGDAADCLHLILKGDVLVERAGVRLGEGDLLGEMGVFTRRRQRTSSASCLSEVTLGRLSLERFWQVYSQDPAFGTYVMQVIVQRLEARQAELEMLARSEAD